MSDVDPTPTARASSSERIARPAVLATIALAVPAAVLACLVAAIVPGIPWWVGIFAGLAIGAGYVWWRVQRSHDLVLDAVVSAAGGVTDSSVRLENVLSSLALVGGIAPPVIRIIEDQALNAMAIRRGSQLTVIVTRGLLDRLELIELEGVAAELVVRLANGDAEAATVGAALFDLTGPLTPVLRLVRQQGQQLLLSGERDLQADREAVSLTRYPPGLLRALKRIKVHATPFAGTYSGLEPLWLTEPGTPHRTSEEGSGENRASLELRIDVLAEL